MITATATQYECSGNTKVPPLLQKFVTVVLGEELLCGSRVDGLAVVGAETPKEAECGRFLRRTAATSADVQSSSKEMWSWYFLQGEGSCLRVESGYRNLVHTNGSFFSCNSYHFCCEALCRTVAMQR